MAVYVDVLITVNFIVDYFLLKITAVILKLKPPLFRVLIASFFASLTSLYIFLPQMNIFLDILIKIAFSLMISLVAFGFKSWSGYLRRSALFSGVTLCYGGIMTVFWQIFKPANMVINNSVVYFDISPTLLVLSSFGFYIIITIIKTFFGRKSENAENCNVTLTVGENSFKTLGILDTGNSLTDPMGSGVTVLVNENDIKNLLKTEEEKRIRFRAMPCKTVTGNALLNGYRTDKMTAEINGKTYTFNNAVAVFSNTPIAEHAVILNPNIFN